MVIRNPEFQEMSIDLEDYGHHMILSGCSSWFMGGEPMYDIASALRTLEGDPYSAKYYATPDVLDILMVNHRLKDLGMEFYRNSLLSATLIEGLGAFIIEVKDVRFLIKMESEWESND